MAGLHRFIGRAGAGAGFVAELLVGAGAGNGRRGCRQLLELLLGCGHGSRLELQQCVQLEHTALAPGGTAAADQRRVLILELQIDGHVAAVRLLVLQWLLLRFLLDGRALRQIHGRVN